MLSDDRRTVSAVVHHLSIWADITGAVAGAAKSVGSAVSSAGYNGQTCLIEPTGGSPPRVSLAGESPVYGWSADQPLAQRFPQPASGGV